MTYGDVMRVEEARARKSLKRRSLGVPVIVRAEPETSSRTKPSTMMPATVPMDVVEQVHADPSALISDGPGARILRNDNESQD